MLANNHTFFDDILLHLDNRHAPPTNPLADCLQQILKHMGLKFDWQNLSHLSELTLENIGTYEQELKIILYQVSPPALGDLSSYLYPVLIQLENGNLHVILKNRWGKFYLFDPNLKTHQPIGNNTPSITISKAWQCCPINFPLADSYRGLITNALAHFKRDIVQTIGLGMIVAFASVFISMIAGYVFGNIHEINQSSFHILFFAYFLLLLTFALVAYINELFIKSLNVKILFFTLPGLWHHLFSLPMSASRHYISGELTQRLLDYETTISLAISLSLTLLLDNIALFMLAIFMAYCNIKFAVLYFIISALFSYFKLLLIPRSMVHIGNQLNAHGKLSSLLNELFLQIQKIRSANVEGIVFKRWLDHLIQLKSCEVKSVNLQIITFAIESIAPLFLTLSLYGLIYTSTNERELFSFLPFIICAGQFSRLFEKISAGISSLIQVLPAFKRIQPLLAETCESFQYQVDHFKLKGKLSFSKVCFSDPDTKKLILDNISIDINQGQFIALIGPSGAGKSTLFKLLLGFESPNSGQITIDKEQLKNLNINEVRKQFGVVLQTTSILPGTIFSNIAANTHLTLDEAWELAHMVGLDNDIRNMPMKMYTYISDNSGESISGGQKQKILIARALATRPKLLLLDEATSALDNDSQQHIYQCLKMLNVTRLVIAHRYSTIVDADCIYVVDQGRILDQGTYGELAGRGRFEFD